MPGATTALDVQQLGKDLVEIATLIQPWAPERAERMKELLTQARQSMAQSQFLVVSNLMLACEEFRTAIASAIDSGLTPGPGSRELERINRLICETTNQRLYTNLSPEF